jgi:hypothetical protein
MRRKFLAWVSSVLILLGVLMPAAAAIAQNAPNSWDVSSSGPVYENNTTTWTYTLTSSGSPPSASQLVLDLCAAFGAITSSPEYTVRENNQLKWNDERLDGSGTVITVQYAGYWAQAAQHWQVTAGNDTFQGNVNGPACSSVNTGFTVSKKVSTTNNPAMGQSQLTLQGGGAVYFFYTIANTGNVPLTISSAMDDVLGDVGLTGTEIAAHDRITATKTQTFPLLPAGSAPQIVTNTLTASLAWGGGPLPPGGAYATVINTPPPVTLSYSVTKTVSTTDDPATGVSQLTLTGGGTVYYFYTVTNTGNVPLPISNATDDKLGPLTFSPTVVPVGGTSTATKSKIFAALPPGAPPETETNIVTVNSGCCHPESAQATVINQPTAIRADFTLSKTVSTINDEATAGGSVTLTGGGTVYYFYTVHNTGNAPLTIASATDDKLGAIAFSPATIAAGGTAKGTASKPFPALAPGSPGQSEVNTISVTAQYDGGSVCPKTAQATVINNAPPPPPGQPDFTLTKRVSTDPDPATGQESVTLYGGGTVYYFYTVTNTGDMPLAITSAIDDKLGPLTFNAVAVPVGGSVTATAYKTFPSPGAPESETNLAIVVAMGGDQPLTREATATVYNNPLPAFSVTKQVSTTNNRADGQDSVTLPNGGQVWYFYTITNQSSVPLAVQSAVDDVLGPIAFTPATIPPGGTALGTGTKPFSALKPGDTDQIEVNTITVSMLYNGEPLGSRTAHATVVNTAPRQELNFSLTKRVSASAEPATGQASITLPGGGIAHYFYTVTNTGNAPLTITSAVDDRLGDITFDPILVPVGGHATATATHTFSPLPPYSPDETVVNTVTVTAGSGDNFFTHTAQATVVNQAPEARPDLTVEKLVSTSANPATGQTSVTITGGTVWYFYTVTNTGNLSVTLRSVNDDKLGAIALAGSLNPGESATAMASKTFPVLSAGTPTQTEINTVTVAFAPTETREPVFTRTSQATVHNQARSTPPPPSDRPDFTVTKSVSTTNDPATGRAEVTLTGGGTAYYFYTLVNTGNVTLTINGAVDDVLGALTFAPLTVPPGGAATATANRTFSALAPGAAPQTETNTISASVSYGGSVYGPKQAKAAVINQPVPAHADFAVTKLVSMVNDPATGRTAVTLNGGGTVYYFYTVTNTGNVPLTITEAVDNKLGPVTLSPASLNPGETATAIASKNFAPSAAGEVETNILTVRASDGTVVYGPKQGTATVTNSARPLGSLQVRVLDGSPRNHGTNLPIAGAQVTLTGGLHGQTDQNGQISFPNLAFGTYQATGRSTDPQNPGQDEKTGSGSATIGQTNPNGTITIILAWEPNEPTPSIAVLACPAFPITGGKVTATGPDGATRTVTQPGADGKYFLQGLTAGVWTVTLQSPGMAAPVSRTITLKDDGSVPQNAYSMDFSDVCPAITGSIQGRICAPPSPGARITAAGPGGKSATALVPSNGWLGGWREYRLTDLVPGAWAITLQAPGSDPVSQTVTVTAGAATRAPDFSLACTGESGQPYTVTGILLVLAGLGLRIPWRRKEEELCGPEEQR